MYRIPVFQSTPPSRGATSLRCADRVREHISIHAPREGGDACIHVFPGAHYKISIHAPREGGDYVCILPRQGGAISIHAPREGGDHHRSNISGRKLVISIHAPREGGDYMYQAISQDHRRFQSTPPARGATLSHIMQHEGLIFQSTPPARGATVP